MRIIALAAGLTLLLSGCAMGIDDHGGVLTLLPDETDIGACTVGEPVRVETLDTMDRPECLPVGSELLFPDGRVLETSDWAASGTTTDSDSPVHYAWAQVGIYGVVAARYSDPCDDMTTWGRGEAVEKLREAFGDGLGYC